MVLAVEQEARSKPGSRYSSKSLSYHIHNRHLLREEKKKEKKNKEKNGKKRNDSPVRI